MKKLVLVPLLLLGLSGCVWYGPGGWGHDEGWHGGGYGYGGGWHGGGDDGDWHGGGGGGDDHGGGWH
ncbi:MAG: hypothetical protein KGH70_05740 [Rhodospirillales bacterium]|nr:hypothetical protein [Rhodospirillales bacterium]